jgi:hypothetical protein
MKLATDHCSLMNPSSLLRLPFPRDLTEGGIAYAARSLPHTYNRMGGSPYDRLRRIVAGVAVELAFRRHLTQNDIPFDVKGATPFTDPDRYDVSLGGHRCDVKSFLLTRREQIRRVRRDPGLLLDAPALVPSDQDAAEGHRDDDLYLFAFATALNAASPRDLQAALAAGQPIHLIHAFPKAWANPQAWTPLGRLALKSDCDAEMTVEIGGQVESREYASEKITLKPRTRTEASTAFFSVASLHAASPPDGRIALRSPARGETYVIPQIDWGNVWVYGMDIFLTGWLPRGEFRQRARFIPSGTRVFQYSETRVKNLAVDVRDLRPLGALLEKVKEWEKTKSP